MLNKNGPNIRQTLTHTRKDTIQPNTQNKRINLRKETGDIYA